MGMDELPKLSTTLMLACRNGHMQHAQLLVEEGADVNESNWHFFTALHSPASINNHAQMQLIDLQIYTVYTYIHSPRVYTHVYIQHVCVGLLCSV